MIFRVIVGHGISWFRGLILLGLALFSKRLCVFGLHGAMY